MRFLAINLPKIDLTTQSVQLKNRSVVSQFSMLPALLLIISSAVIESVKSADSVLYPYDDTR